MSFTPNPAELNSRFRPIGQGWTIKELPLAASTAMGQGAALYYNETGECDLVTDSTGNFAGILMESVQSTDDDYATEGKLRAVAVPASESSECEFEVGDGTFTAADVGKTVTFEDSVSVDVDTAGTQLRIVKYLRSNRGICTFSLALS